MIIVKSIRNMGERMHALKIGEKQLNEYYYPSENQLQSQRQQQKYLLNNTIRKTSKSNKLKLQRLQLTFVKRNIIWTYVCLQLFLLLLLFIFVDITTASKDMLGHMSHYTDIKPYKKNSSSRIRTRTNVKVLSWKNVNFSLPFDTYTQLPKFKRLTISNVDLEGITKGFSKSNVSVHYKYQTKNNNQKLQNYQLTETQRNYETNQNEKYVLEESLNNFSVNLTTISKGIETIADLLTDYMINFFAKGQYETLLNPLPELGNFSAINESNWPKKSINITSIRTMNQTTTGITNITIEASRNLASGRVLFLTGLKKILWPLFMGIQILKSLLIAMFIPAIIGSLGKIFNKGISSGSAPLFIRPMEGPTELDFRDNAINFDDDNKFSLNDAINPSKDHDPYSFHQAEASQLHGQYVQNSLDPLGGLTRLGLNERQQQLMQDTYFSALKGLGSASFQHSGSLATSSSSLLSPLSKSRPSSSSNVANTNTFHSFHKVPDSSLLLSNYDPFYSPLLSRLDLVFAQLKLNSTNENCREKVICLMYSNPTKYAPYSNLVSAQLSRELNELRKPTSDNPDILRFFKYMRAAKDGQDGIDCELIFNECPEFKDFENPAMVSTYNDINKLVEARQML